MMTLASDFGTPYPAAMKGVICRHTDAQLVDIAHDFPRQDLRTAAFWLRETVPTFPPAVHLAVVDPGVGTDRRAIAIAVGDHVLVGPDNGLLWPVCRRLQTQTGDDSPAVFEIRVENPDSTTFHGRDVFAPAAAVIHEAIHVGETAKATNTELAEIDRLAPTTQASCVDLQLPTPTVEKQGPADGTRQSETVIRGEVLVVDDFGNVITNIAGEAIADCEDAVLNGEAVPVVETFANVATGQELLTVGSHGYVECDVNQGRGDDRFGLSPRDSVTLSIHA